MTGSRPSKDFVNRAELVERLALAMPQLSLRDVELAVRILLAHLIEALTSGQRIELRGFGSFSLHYLPPRAGRNPRTGRPVSVPGRYVPHFKPGKALRERVNRNHTPRAVPQPRSSARYAAHAKNETGARDIST